MVTIPENANEIYYLITRCEPEGRKFLWNHKNGQLSLLIMSSLTPQYEKYPTMRHVLP